MVQNLDFERDNTTGSETVWRMLLVRSIVQFKGSCRAVAMRRFCIRWAWANGMSPLTETIICCCNRSLPRLVRGEEAVIVQAENSGGFVCRPFGTMVLRDQKCRRAYGRRVARFAPCTSFEFNNRVTGNLIDSRGKENVRFTRESNLHERNVRGSLAIAWPFRSTNIVQFPIKTVGLR